MTCRLAFLYLTVCLPLALLSRCTCTPDYIPRSSEQLQSTVSRNVLEVAMKASGSKFKNKSTVGMMVTGTTVRSKQKKERGTQ